MEAKTPEPWHLRLHAKAKNFQFKLKAAAAAATSLQNLSLKQLSVLLNLYSFQLTIHCDSGSAPKRRRRTIKSKFLRVFKRFRSRRAEENRASFSDKKCWDAPYPENESESKSMNRQFRKFRFRRADNRSVSSDGKLDKLRWMRSNGGLGNWSRFAAKSWVVLSVILMSVCIFTFDVKKILCWVFL